MPSDFVFKARASISFILILAQLCWIWDLQSDSWPPCFVTIFPFLKSIPKGEYKMQ